MYNLKKRKHEKNTNFAQLAIVLILISIAIGFAYVQTTLSINGETVIANQKDMLDIYFDNISVNKNSVKTSSEPVIDINKPTRIYFSVELNSIGDFYEFEVDVINRDERNAKVLDIGLDGVSYEVSRYVESILTYKDCTNINVNDALPAGETERIKVRFNYTEDAANSMEIVEGATGKLSFYIKYEQDFGDGTPRKKGNLIQRLGLDSGAYSSNTKSQFVTSETGISYEAASSDTNGKGLYIFPGTEDEKNPIYFYRGAVTDNNLIFAGFCWKIVRTTEKGGTKLIYNGLPTDTSQCTNTTGNATQLSNSVFNSSTAAKYLGYMYDTDTDSNVKGVIDNWFSVNLKGYTDYLEDAVWCNDMSLAAGSTTYYGSYNRVWTLHQPDVRDEYTCVNPEDRYTVSTTNGNGRLTYPVGLLTADEVALGGFVNNSGALTTTSYLYTNFVYWTMSPAGYISSRANLYAVWNTGCFLYAYNNNNYGVRPSIVLNSEAFIIDGDGTVQNPYMVFDEPVLRKFYMPFNGEEGYADNEGSQYISTYKGVNLSTVASDTNGKGLYIIGDTLEEEYPIYYYRGAVTNNNVLFANYCWKIVRTTETGGTKLLYNGVPSNGQCTATGTATQFSTTAMFNPAINNSKYVGYMYDTNTNSTVKTAIDNWYSSNMTGYTDMLEDAIWCNDMSVSSTSGSDVYYGAYNRLWIDKIPKVKDAETCPNESDRYTVSVDNGNGKLTYPVGLLTADELIYGGVIHVNNVFNTTTYLYTGQTYWTMTPEQYASSKAGVFMMWTKGSTLWDPANTSYGVRPAISLKAGVTAIGGNGTTTSPYIV